ncbi:MAG: hypothetical protein ABIW38_13100 [Ferruginibacter sp.]
MKYLYLGLILFLAGCSGNDKNADKENDVNLLAEKYVRLGLKIGQYDADFVDAYYGPDSLKPIGTPATVFPKDSLLAEVNALIKDCGNLITGNDADSISHRAKWISEQLVAYGRRIKIFSGEFDDFDKECKELFGTSAPVYTQAHFQQVLASLDSLLPGKGAIQDRFQQLANRFIIPTAKLDTVFKTAIAESRKRTMQYFSLPAEEKFSLEYVTNKSWSGYNWYKGNYTSLIQINTENKIFIERVIDVGSHESYPGHHVYNMLLEKNLYRDKGWVEISMYPLFSPQSLIAEGSANYGIELAFPGQEKIDFAKNVLLPLAGLDTTGIEFYFKALALKSKLAFARNEVARGIINNTMNEDTAINYLKKYALNNEETAKKSISFTRKYRGYVINYNHGMQLIQNYIEKYPVAERWAAFGKLLSNEISTAQLEENK